MLLHLLSCTNTNSAVAHLIGRPVPVMEQIEGLKRKSEAKAAPEIVDGMPLSKQEVEEGPLPPPPDASDAIPPRAYRKAHSLPSRRFQPILPNDSFTGMFGKFRLYFPCFFVLILVPLM